MAFFILESALRCELKQEEQQLKLCLGISSSHSCNSLEDAGLGLFVPSGAERAYFRLCTMHFRLGCCAESIVLRSRLLPLQNSQWSKFFPV